MMCPKILRPLLRWVICCGVHGILCARIHCAITLISPLPVVVLCLGAASLDSLRNPAYGGLRGTVRGVHGD
jgi:hypothetical protein